MNKKDQAFWDHYFKMAEVSEFGSEGTMEKLDRLNTINDLEKRHYVLANIPEKYWHFEFDQIKEHIIKCGMDNNNEPVAVVEKYLNSLNKVVEKGIGLYLSGPHGTAKTTISIIVLKKAIDLRYRCFFVKSTEVIEFARSGWKSEDRKIFFDYVINTVDFLVVDDVARLTEVSEAEKIHIDKIFTKRDDMNLVTIMTANHEIEENREKFGEALFSNFNERLLPVHFVGDDYRNRIGNSLLESL